MWRSKYDMSPEEFTKELDRLWDQVKPFYLSLHAYVRMKLHDKYGDIVPAKVCSNYTQVPEGAVWFSVFCIPGQCEIGFPVIL